MNLLMDRKPQATSLRERESRARHSRQRGRLGVAIQFHLFLIP